MRQSAIIGGFVLSLVTLVCAAPKEFSAPFADTLMAQLLSYFPDSVKQCRIAVYPFVDETSDPGFYYSIWTAEYFAMIMRRNPRFSVVGKSELQRTLQYLDISVRDEIDDDAGQEISRALKTQYFLIGTLRQSAGRFRVEARIVDAQSGVIVTGADRVVHQAELEDVKNGLIEGKAGSRLSPALGRSIALPGWGQLHRGRVVPGIVFPIAYLGALGGVGALIGPMLEAQREYDEFKEYFQWSPQMKSDMAVLLQQGFDSTSAYKRLQEPEVKLYAALRSRTRTVGIAAAVAGSVWAINLADVIIAGQAPKRQFRLLYSTDFREQAALSVCFGL